MARNIGTSVWGIRAPIAKKGDNVVNFVLNAIDEAVSTDGIKLKDHDVIGVTESLVARSQGNYAQVDDIAADINAKISGPFVILFPILSRNRFALLLKGMARAGKKIYLLLNYPSDEVGNHLMDVDAMDEAHIDPHADLLTEEDYRKTFGKEFKHPFTGLDYVEYYKSLGNPGQIEIILTNRPKDALKYSKEILIANIHERQRLKKILIAAGADKVYKLDEILAQPVNGSGYNPEYGILGSNKATEDSIKLFPRDCQAVVDSIQKGIKDKTGKNVEVMIYGDGAFKDPVGKIWELADPCVSPGYTQGLSGMPNEIKIKYIADNDLKNMDSAQMMNAMKERISSKESNIAGKDESTGTTPRQLTDLLGSLCDLTTGSGDKGTPIVLIQGYFDNYATE